MHHICPVIVLPVLAISRPLRASHAVLSLLMIQQRHLRTLDRDDEAAVSIDAGCVCALQEFPGCQLPDRTTLDVNAGNCQIAPGGTGGCGIGVVGSQ